MSVRYICAGKHHPDHDTICTFRVKNEKAIGQAFLQVLKLAREMGVLKVGTVSVDGTKIKANASIHKSLRYDRAGQLEAQLKLEIDGLMKKAREAETNEPRDQEELAGELQRLDTLRQKMRRAQETLEKRAKDSQKPKKNDKDDPGSPPGLPKPEPKHQVNLTDSDSRIMRKNNRSGYEQAYNAQAVVDATGSMLVLGGRVSNVGPDSGQLAIDIDSVPTEVGTIETVIADTGYASGEPIQQLQGRGMEVIVALGKQAKMHRRAHDFRPVPKDDPNRKAPIVWRKPWVVGMRKLLESERGQQIYKLRKQSVEPVFGIIKAIYRSPGDGVPAVPATRTGEDQSGMAIGYLCLQSEKIGCDAGLRPTNRGQMTAFWFWTVPRAPKAPRQSPHSQAMGLNPRRLGHTGSLALNQNRYSDRLLESEFASELRIGNGDIDKSKVHN